MVIWVSDIETCVVIFFFLRSILVFKYHIIIRYCEVRCTQICRRCRDFGNFCNTYFVAYLQFLVVLKYIFCRVLVSL